MKTSMLTQLITVILAVLSAKAFAGTATYSATNTIFENPERGFHELISNSESFNPSVSTHPVAAVNIRLDRFKNGAALDSCFLTNLANSFAAARTAGVKLRVYFKYNYGPDTTHGSYTACNGQVIHNDGRDASLDTIRNQHIPQLGPILNQYSDVIYAINAGFIGWFGEWHDSTNGLDTVSAHNSVISRELTFFPANRHILLRRPAYKLNYIGCNCPGNTPRLGHHNQGIFDDSDEQIFNDPQGNWSADDCRAFYSNDVSFTANGADATERRGLIDGVTAFNRMRQYHYTLMNAYPELISHWQTNYPTYYARMQRELGYRIQVTRATTPNTVNRGQNYTVSVNLINNGFSKLMNSRSMYLAFLHPGGAAYVAPVAFTDSNGGNDLRSLTLAAGEMTWTANFTLPADFPTGAAQTFLWLYDTSSTYTAANPKFSIRLDGVTWNTIYGANQLTSTLNNIQVQ
jgi:hypothetical protein